MSDSRAIIPVEEPSHPRYELIRGKLEYVLDPAGPDADTVVDLALARTGDDGMVRFEGDIQLLVPAEPPSANGGLLYVVANRGTANVLPFAASTSYPDPSVDLSVGDAWALRRGWTLMWSGWQWDVDRGSTAVGLSCPELAGPVEGRARAMFRVGADCTRHPLQESLVPGVATGAVPYPVSAHGDPGATLTVRRHYLDAPRPVPAAQWSFSRDRNCVEMPGGFAPGSIYEITYRTDRAPVVGAGLAAVRDAVSWVRYADDSPVAGRIDRSLGTGSSQSGRFLRQFLHDAMNADGQGRPVFDGVLCHVAGTRRGEFNHRFASPGVTWTMGEGSTAPFTTADLLARQQARGCAPRLFSVNSSSEYWRGDAALAHIDTEQLADLTDPPGARHYLVAADHFGYLPVADLIPAVHPPASIDAGLVTRALFEALDRWVRDEVEPPPSRVPRIDDSSAVPREDVRSWFSDLGVEVPDASGLHPAALGADLAAYVSAVDEHGREISGIQTPAAAARSTVTTGWNVFRSLGRGEARLAPEFLGSTLEVVASKVDPTLPTAREVADQLVSEGFLLAEDRDRALADAAERTGTPTRSTD